MAQVFHPSFNSIARVSIAGALLLAGVGLFLLINFNRLAWATDVEVVRDQPVQFSHDHHVSGLGLDCRYCHTSVEVAASAGIPPTKTCMTCHSQVWNDAAILEPVRASYREDRSLEWIKVHDLPGFVYFDHSIHVAKGVGCESCHGRVDKMPLMWKTATLNMEWCLACHREPEQHLRPLDQVMTMGWDPVAALGRTQADLGAELKQKYDVQNRTNCSSCHR